MAEFRYRGREILEEDILYIRTLIERYPKESRRKLSVRVCEAWQWRQANGALRDMVCRGMLLMLERAGQIALPPVSYMRHNPLSKRARPEPVLIDKTPLEDPLHKLQPLEFEQVRRTAQEPLFNSLMEEHHYLGYEQPVGEHLKFLVWAAGPANRVPGMVIGSAPHRQSRPLHRLGCRGAAQPHPLHRLQHTLPDPAVGTSRASGVAYPGPDGGADLRRLAADVRSSDLLPGDVHRSGTVPRDLLPCGQLGADGQDDGTRQAIQQLRSEPVDQGGSGISVDEAFS